MVLEPRFLDAQMKKLAKQVAKEMQASAKKAPAAKRTGKKK